MIKIQCPYCKVEYVVTKPQHKMIECLNCNKKYFQSIHKISNFEFVRQAVLKDYSL